MLAADTYMELIVNWLTKLDSHFHKLAYTCLVELCEWVVFKNLAIIVSVEELTSVITAEAECHLSKVVCTEAEEVSFLSNLISCKSSSWDFNHCTNFILKLNTSSSDFSISCLYNYLLNILKFLNLANERNHDFWLNCPIRMCLLNIDSCTDNSLCLHLCNFRICYCKTAATVTHHWVELVEGSDDSLNLLNCLTLCISKLLNVSLFCWNELMKRWVKETNCNRITFKSLIESLEVALLIWENLLESCFSLFNCIGANHLTECSNSVFLEEHMLCTAKTDTFSTKLTSLLSVSRCISICSNLKSSVLISPSHNSAELASDCSVYCWDNTLIDVTC